MAESEISRAESDAVNVEFVQLSLEDVEPMNALQYLVTFYDMLRNIHRQGEVSELERKTVERFKEMVPSQTVQTAIEEAARRIPFFDRNSDRT